MPDSTSRPAYNFATVPVHARSPLSIQTKLAISQPAEQAEQEADRAAEQLTRAEARAASDRNEPPRLNAAEPRVQRQAMNEAPASPTEIAQPSEPATPEITPEPATPSETLTAGLLVDDEATELSPGQMKKSEFLDALRTSVCRAADAELAAVGRSTEGCPYVEQWIGYYRTRSSAQVERAVRKYAPETAGVPTAREYIPLITAQVQRGVATWATTGQITGVPEELATQLLGGGVVGAIVNAASSVLNTVGTIVSGIGSLFFKAREGGAREVDAQGIHGQLGVGSSLDSGVRTRMESAFGHDFSRVRVHADGQAANLSSSLNARAFTIGSDIAFGTGEYQPGTLIGDTLLAHELAHVVQQGGGSSSAHVQHGSTGYKALEEDADLSAVNAVASIWGRAKGVLARTGKNALPRLKSGLSISRCSKGSPCSATETQTITTAKQTAAGWVTTALGKLRTTPVPADVSAGLQRNFGATDGVAANIPSIITKITTANTEMTTVPISCAGTEDSTCATAPCGYTPSAGGHAYVICRNATLKPTSDPIYQAGCTLHEAFHSAFSDFSGDSYSGWGGHSGSTAGYPGTNPLKNADSYASLVIDLK